MYYVLEKIILGQIKEQLGVDRLMGFFTHDAKHENDFDNI